MFFENVMGMNCYLVVAWKQKFYFFRSAATGTSPEADQ